MMRLGIWVGVDTAFALGIALAAWRLGALAPISVARAEQAEPPRSERKILYYRNPIGAPDTSPVPKKDSMGMDYIPVYADEQGGPGTVKVSLDKIQRIGVRSEKV